MGKYNSSATQTDLASQAERKPVADPHITPGLSDNVYSQTRLVAKAQASSGPSEQCTIQQWVYKTIQQHLN